MKLENFYRNHLTGSNFKIALTTLFFTLICFGIYGQSHYSYDAYMYFIETGFSVKATLSLGRYCMAFASFVMSCFHINVVKAQGILFCMVLFSIVFAISSNYMLVIGSMKDISIWNKWMLYIFCLISYLNIFVDEWFRFPEGYIMFGPALFFASLGIVFFAKDHSVTAFLCLFLALGFYQAVLGIFINWTIGIIFAQFYDDIAHGVKKVITCMIIAGAASFMNIFLTSAFVLAGWADRNSRQASFSLGLIFNNIKNIITEQKFFLINGYNLLPANLLLICFVVLLALLFASNWKRSLINIIMLLILYSSPFLPFIISGDMWMAQRTVASYFSVYAVIAVMICAENRKKGKRGYSIQAITVIVGSCLLFLNIRTVNRLAVEQISINKMDYIMCKSIEQEILYYEQSTGYMVDTVAVAQDENPVSTYPGITAPVYDTNLSALKVTWCLQGLFKYAMDRDFQVISMDDHAFQKWFAGKNWNVLNTGEQIRFQDHTMYLVLW